ncbi:hypothetical protein KGA66_09065 [Actinocrinis puniceicyclus]|uniref:Fumarate lyase N-terminal domain-containing protein n=1 Tax=Actinocrinis puniceicyclus TaxID=977794 RepID=A0A8J7WNT2_9ACTN|nr:lyase family protein [Actinocrinis puniceicyclus]MBS2963194.1 hypothetical protein [Actinocrinis puniceicyclus]
MPRRYSSPSPWDDDPPGTLLAAESALARAQAELGRIPRAAAEAIEQATRQGYDYDEIRALGQERATVVVPLGEAIRARLPAEHHEHLHRPATSQEIIDTALMLQAARTLGPVTALLDRCAESLGGLTRRFGDTHQRARALLQPALPSTFGNLLGSWRSAVDDARSHLHAVRERGLAVQLGGPVADLDDPRLVQAFAESLGLTAPGRAWHTVRTRVVDLAAALGLTVGVLGKIGADVIVLSQAEVGELAQGAAGRSSSMPDKQNPARAVQLVALAARAPGLVATVFAALPQELQRAAGRWQAEDATVRELLVLAGEAAHHAAILLEGLVVHPDRMKANLDA